MSIPSAHPPDDRLKAFGLGRLDPNDTESVAEHVEACTPCATVLNLLPSDDFLTALRDAVHPTAEPPTQRRLEETSGSVPTTVYTDPSSIPPELDGHPRYRVAELLGRGGMGAVYRADHMLMDRPVALKVVSSELFENDEALARFRHEVRAAARLNHPNIVAAYDADQAGSLTFLVMEYVEGHSLAEILKSRGRMSVTQACQYARQVALGLQHAHDKGMVHRDIKPHNLMLTPSGEVKVLDFGLARFVCEQTLEPDPHSTDPDSATMSKSASLTQTGVVMGTVDYMAPEQARNSRQADIRADIYSLGCTLYHFLTGRVPFVGGDVTSKLTRLLREEPESITRLRPDVPKPLAAVVARMMAKKPENRYQTPAEVVAALTPFTGEPTARHRRVGWIAMLLLLVTAGAIFALRGGGKSEEVRIDTDAFDVELIANSAGEIVRVRDRLADRTWTPEPGLYRLAQADEANGVTLELDDSTRLTLHRTAEGVRARWNAHALVPTSVVPDKLRAFGAGAPVAHGLAVSPDGRFAVSSGGLDYAGAFQWKSSLDADLRLWDLASGREVGRLSGQSGHVGCVAFSPDARHVAGAAGHEKSVRVWDVRSGKAIQLLEGHTAEVNGVAYSPDGRRLLSASWDKTLRLWDATTGVELLRFGEGLSDWSRVAFSPDGRFTLAAGLERLSWFDLATGEEVHRFAAEGLKLGRVVGAAVSSNGRYVLSGSAESDDHAVRLWDTNTGKLIRTLGYFGTNVHAVAFTPDGEHALATGFDSSLRLWRVADGVEEFRAALASPVVSLAVTPDGRHALAGCVDRSIRVVQLDNPHPPTPVGEVRQMLGHTSSVRAVAVAPNGRIGYSVCWDRTLRAWDLNTGRELRRIGEGTNPAEELALSADGRRMISAHSSDPVRIWDLESGKELFALKGHTANVHTVAIADDGLHGLSGGADNTVRLWDLKTGKTLRTLSGHTGVVCALAFCKDGRRALSGSHDKTMRLWDLETGQELKKFEGFADWVLGLAVSPDGRHALSTGGPGNTARLWDLQTGAEVRRFVGHARQLHSVAFSSDGKHALTGAFDGTLRYWSVSGGTAKGIYGGHFGYVTSVTFCRDDTYALSGGQDGTVRLWRLPDFPATVFPQRIGVSGTHVLSVAFTPQGDRLLAGSDGDHVLQFDVAGGRQVGAVGKCGWSSAVAVSPDGKLGASGHSTDSPSGVVRIFEMETGRVLHRLPAHEGETLAVAFHPRGDLLATGGRDGRVRLWDVRSGTRLRTLEGHPQGIYQIAFNPDGTRLASAGWDEGVRLWDTSSGSLIRTVPGSQTVALLPNGEHILTGSRDESGLVRLWKLDGTTPERTWQTGALVSWLSIAPDGTRFLATHHHERRLTVWDVATSRLRLACIDPIWKPNRAVFSPDGKTAVAGGLRGGISVWNLAATATDPATPVVAAFRETHSATEAELRQWIYRVSREGFRLTSVSVGVGSPEPRFNALAVRDGRDLATDYQILSGAEPGEYFRLMSQSGYRPLVSCLYADGGKQKQVHVWVADGSSFGGYGTTFAKLATLLEEHGRKKRMMPIYISSETAIRGGDEITVILAPDNGVQWELSSGLTLKELQATATAVRERRWRITHLAAYDQGQGVRFFAVIADNRNNLAWDCQGGLSEEQYAKALKDNSDRLHPIAVGSYRDGGEWRYAALWTAPATTTRGVK